MARSARRRGRPRATRSADRRGDARDERAGLTGNGGADGAPPAPARVARPAPSAPRRRFGFLRRLQPRFVGDVIAELRKVTWPSIEDTRYLTIVVSIVAVTVGIFLGAVDLLFGWIIEQVFFT